MDYPAAQPVTPAANFETTVLDNGLRVISDNTPACFGSLGLYVKSGPRYENTDTLGASHFVKRLAFTRTYSRSPVTVCRGLELDTGSFNSSVSREHNIYTAELITEKLTRVLPLFGELFNPFIQEYTVRDISSLIERETSEAAHNPTTSFIEAVHREAYRDFGLGNSLFCAPFQVGNVSVDTLSAYMVERYILRNATLVGVGFKHDHLLKSINQFFLPYLPSYAMEAGSTTATSGKYYGGEARTLSGDNTRVALVFEGVSQDDKDAVALRVLTGLVGGSVRHTRDGPGRGLRSRLYRNVVEKSDSVVGTATLEAYYSDSGLWGVYAEALPGAAAQVTDLLAQVLSGLNTIDDGELARAKNQAKAAFFRGLESRTGLLDYLGRSGAKPLTLTEFGASVDALTKADVQNVAKRVLKSPLTLVSSGNIYGLPTREELKAKISKQ